MTLPMTDSPLTLVHVGNVPYERGWQKPLLEGYGRRALVIHLEPDPLPLRFTGPRGLLHGPELPGDLPTAGLVRVWFPGAIPGNRFAGVSRLSRWVGLRRLLIALRRRGRSPVVVLHQVPTLLPTLRGLPADLQVYQVVDDYVGLAADASHAAGVARAHRRLARQADMTWTTACVLLPELRRLAREVVEITNGVDTSAFTLEPSGPVPPALDAVPRPRVGLVGNLNDRIDWELIEALCRDRPGYQVVLIGPVFSAGPGTTSSLNRLAERPNFHHLPAVPPAAVPACIHGLDVGLIPYRLSGGTLAVNPLKAYQYLAAGRPVVATPLPALGRFEDVVALAGTTAEFLNAVDQALETSGDPEAQARRRARVAPYDWDTLAQDRLALVRQHLESKPTGRRGPR